MKDKTIALISVLLLGALALSACYEIRAANAEQRLEAAVQQLPAPPGAVVVHRVITTTGGTMPECEGREAHALLGTNEVSFGEVLDFYTSTLPSAGWDLDPKYATNARGRGFAKRPEFILEVSDAYNSSMVGPDAVREGKARFRTIYLLYLATPLQQPVPSQCERW